MPNARITKARIKFISLCPRGANRMPVIYKEGDLCEFVALTKASADLGEITNVVYAPEVRDSQGDIASAEVIKDMAHAFFADGGQVDIRHDGKAVPREKAYLAESFIVAKGDARFADFKDVDGKPVDVTGGWATVIKVDDPALREAYRKGEWNGVSMAGTASKQVEKSEDIEVGLFARLLKFLTTTNTPAPKAPQESDMTQAEIANLVKETVTSALAAAGVKPAEAPKAPVAAEPAAPVFKGDATKLADLVKFEEELAAFEITKGLTSTDPSVRAEALKKAKEAAKGESNSGNVEKSEEVKRLEAELAKARGASKAPVAAEPASEGYQLTKEDKEALAAGDRMADLANSERGIHKPAK